MRYFISKKIFFLLCCLILSSNLDALTFTVDTNIEGETPSTKFLISTNGDGYDYTLDCEDDGTLDYGSLDGDFNCTYSTPGVYQIRIYGDFPEIAFNYYEHKDAKKLISLDEWGDHSFRTLKKAFYYATNLEINASDVPHLEEVTSMKSAFQEIKAINSTNLNDWNVSHVENMAILFAGIYNFNKYIGDWNVSNVTDMLAMFWETGFNQDISRWDVSHVKYMDMMFSFSDFNQPIGGWNVSSVESMGYMFQGADSFNQPIGDWDMSNVKNIEGMFAYASDFNQDIGAWNLASVEGSFRKIFIAADKFNQDIGDWDTSRITDMNQSFDRAHVFNQDLSDWNISNVTEMYNIFKDTNISTTQYDNTLVNWQKNPHHNNIDMSSVNSYYCDDGGRSSLIDDGWNIDDRGENCSLIIYTTNHVSIDSGEVDVLSVGANPSDDTYFSITGGADADKFSITEQGSLKFINPPRVKSDKNRDDIYRVQVMAKNQNNRDSQTIKVKVLTKDTAVTPLLMYLLN